METVRDLLEFLKGMPDDTKLLSFKIDRSVTVIFVDSNGNARPVTTTTKKWVQVNIQISLN